MADLNKDAGRTGVYGSSGSGKSHFVKQLIAQDKRLVVFDPLSEYAVRRDFVTVKSDLRPCLNEIKARWQRGFRLAYVPSSGDEIAELNRLSRVLLHVQKPYFDGVPIPKVTLVIEEMNLSFPNRDIGAHFTGFPEICSRGRHSGIEVIGVSQGVSEVSTRFRKNCNRTVYFRQDDYTERKTIAGQLGPKYRDIVAELSLGEYLDRRGGQVERVKGKK